MTRLYTILMVVLLQGICLPGEVFASGLKKVTEVRPSEKTTSIKQPASSRMKMQRVAVQSDEGIGGSLMCKDVTAETYSEYGGTYLIDNYIWRWERPDDIICEETQTVLNYSSPNTFFGFQIDNGAPRIEAIKIYLDPTRTNNASVRSVWASFEEDLFYYIDALATADYDTGVIYWKNDFQYDLDNIYFFVESGELNVVGFELYSQGRTPDDFFSGIGEYGVATPRFNPVSCNFYNPLKIEISAEEGCSVYYRTDGSVPTVREADKYQDPIVISTTTTIKAIAADSNGNTSSIVTQKYTCTRHGIGEDYDPSSPGNPGTGEDVTTEKSYHLTVVTNPVGAGSSYANNYDLKAGEQTYVYTNNATGYTFKNWTIEGEEVSTATRFYYLMPDYDVTIVANYYYTPVSPGNPSPEEQKVKHPATVRAIPSVAASMSPSGAFDMEENTSRNVYAYPYSGWKLTGWTINGEQQPSEDSSIIITMGEKALDIAAYFTYKPTSPSNPGANYYNPSTGQVIIDDFTPGNLYSALSDLVGSYDYSNISSLIVKGQITSNDMGHLSYLSNAGTIDLSRTGGITEVPSYTFDSMGASSILLPSTITSIGYRAFQNCSNLTSITIYALVPPICEANTFYQFTNKDNCTIYVPRESIELYQNADQWKDFTILPIKNDAHVLQVNLPEDAADGRYKHNSIEIVNLSTGVRQKYVVSDRLVYTFNGLQKDEQYNVYMLSQSGLEIGRIENVVIPNDDIEVTFEDLKTLHTAVAKVLAPDGTDVTPQVSVEWLKPLEDGTTTYLRKSISVSEIPEGELLLCRIGLDNKLGTVYVNPEDVEFTVNGSDNNCIVNLVPFRTVGLSGVVVDGDGSALSGASVSATQVLNGKHSKTYTAKTDRKGEWSINVLDAPETNLTFAASECVNVNDTIGAFDSGIVSFDCGKTTMKSIVGARVSYGFTYHAAGEEDVDNYYPDYQNVAISVYNETQDRAHNEVSAQYPLLAVLDENINAGDKLKLTATSKTGAFNPIVETVTIGDDQRAEVTFDIVGKGGIQASFEMTDNPAVVAMLYSDKGELVKKKTYSEAKTTFTGLEDGNYTLVSMGQSDLMNSILRLSNFAEIGLAENKDYVVNAVKVESGKLSEVNNSEIPAFDESVFYYTNSSTGFSANKSSITTGNYLTLRAAIDFKRVYKDAISNVALVVDLPESCDFVEQSVIQGPNLLPYTIDKNRLTIQLGDNYQGQIRFCVMPTIGGSFNASALIVFDYDGKTVTQPIGTSVSEIKDIEITVPSVIAGTSFKVSGMALGNSLVNIYEEGTLLGSGKANAAGSWSVDCNLIDPQNLSSHPIYAELTTSQNHTLISEKKTITYDMNALRVSKVTMINTAHPSSSLNLCEYVTVFDFMNPEPQPAYWYWPSYPKFTFLLDFTDNNPEKITNVVLYVHTTDGDIIPLVPIFDESKHCWITQEDFYTSALPANVSVDYDALITPLCDMSQMSEKEQEANQVFENFKSDIDFINSLLDSDGGIQAEYGTMVEELFELIDAEADFVPEDFDNWSEEKQNQYLDEQLKDWEKLDSQIEDALNRYLVTFSDSSDIVTFEDGSYIETSKCENLDKEQLLTEGYIKVDMIDDSEVYVLVSDKATAIANFTTNIHLIAVTPNEITDDIRYNRYSMPVSKISAGDVIRSFASKMREYGDRARAFREDANILDVLAFIKDEIGYLDGGLPFIKDACQKPVDKAFAEYFKAKSEFGRYKYFGNKCKNFNKRAMYKQMAFVAEARAAKLFIVYKATKVVMGGIVKALPFIDWICLLSDSYAKGTDLYDMEKYLDKIKICKDDQKSIIEEYRSKLRWLIFEVISFEVGNLGLTIAGDLSIAAGVAAAAETAGISLSLSFASFLVKACGQIGFNLYNDNLLKPKISKLKSEIHGLKFVCPEDPEDKDKNSNKNSNNSNKNGGKEKSPIQNVENVLDPSGYVYEAIPANRVEGVQATIYYKETKEDMYGDPYEEIILWNAEEYAQKNPLFTDEYGMYQWDVPQGLWQVKFEKDGYATAYSEWLPVPPPQLEVNIGIVQNKQPEVIDARAYEDGIEVQFDKFMDLSTLNTSNIYVTANGEKLKGEISMIDSALADEYANEEDKDAIRYASRVRFIPEESLSVTTGEVRVTVSRNVLSYAGIPMTETYSQTLEVKKEVKAIVADDVKVLYGGEKEVTISAIPFDAAVGRKVHIANSSDLIASINADEVILDDEGKAVITIKGDLPGRSQLSFSIDDVTETGDCMVDVVTEIITAEAPKSSRASGTAVYRGTKIELTTESKDATIYFTTDGSCPCDENGTRRKYTVPIIVNDDTKILAMTSVGNGDDDVSETVEFNYTLKRSDIDFQMEEGWTWISHNLDVGIAPSELSSDESIRRVVSQTQEVIRDPQLGLWGNLKELSPSESYKVQTTAATPRQRLSGITWNPNTHINVTSGWNWLSYPISQTMTVEEAFATTKAETLDVIVGQSGFAQYDGENWVGTLDVMSPGKGYMYYSNSNKDIVYNNSIVSTAAAKNVARISNKSSVVVDIHKYGVVMPMVASLIDFDGNALDNDDYQVVAFCGTECRGIGKVVNGFVMMNVYGDIKDDITFQVTDSEGEITYSNDASLKFSERVVGDVFNPYTISIGNANGVAGVAYSGNVKVYFEGDMLRIKGISHQDIRFVEVYDINGQKLLHESNIEKTGVRVPTLSDGIYIVIVNGNGEYTYHKIAK